MNPTTGSLTDLALALRSHVLQGPSAPVAEVATDAAQGDVHVAGRDIADAPTRSDWLRFAAPAACAGTGLLGSLLGM